MESSTPPVDNSKITSIEIQKEKDQFQLRKLSALVLIAISIMYLYFGDNNKTLEIIMLALAGFLVGVSVLKQN